MSSSNKDKRARLFDLYNKQLTFYRPDLQDVFICPLCPDGQGYLRLALDVSRPELTLAHIIPQSLGGRACTLACATCNSSVGHELEPSLVGWLATADWPANIGRMRGQMTGPFGSVPVEIQLPTDQRRWSIFVGPGGANPAQVEAIKRQHEEWRRGQRPAEIKLSWRYPYRPRRFEVAVYQSALLLLFRHFGYEFLHHPHYQPLREQVRGPDEEIWRTRIVNMSAEAVAPALGKERHAVLFCREPRFIMAVLRLRPDSGRERIFGVMLPGLDNPEVPKAETGKMVVAPYEPDEPAGTRGYFRQLWEETGPGG